MKLMHLAFLTATSLIVSLTTGGATARAGNSNANSQVSCGMTDVNVTATRTDDHFQYSYGCYFFGSGFPIRVFADVTADYDKTTQTASESIHARYHGEEYTSTWSCTSDPWVNEDQSTDPCTGPPHFYHLTGDPQYEDLIDFWNCYFGNPAVADWVLGSSGPECSGYSGTPPGNEPLSVPEDLGLEPQLHVLAAQLQNAINALPPPPQTSIRNAATCAACIIAGELNSSSGAAAALPDFSITRISGPQQLSKGSSGTYDVVLANLGAKPSQQVQVEIQVNGSLSYLQMTQTPSGFDCLGNGPIICTGPLGGSGDPLSATVANFQLQIQGSQAGLGSISATANPSGAIQESDTTNDSKTLAVTVN
jgi:CARDB